MLFRILAALAVSSLPLLAVAGSTQTPAPMAAAATSVPDFQNPYHRPSFDEHKFPPPALDVEKVLKKRQSGSANFIVHMCRDTAQQSCDKIWVSSAQFCYDNFHWFGWTGGTMQSAKIEGTMCCAFFTDTTCNKAGGYTGWAAQICQDDTGDALITPGGIQSWMCNIPYGSANRKMANSPPEVSIVPSQYGGGPEVATQKV